MEGIEYLNSFPLSCFFSISDIVVKVYCDDEGSGSGSAVRV